MRMHSIAVPFFSASRGSMWAVFTPIATPAVSNAAIHHMTGKTIKPFSRLLAEPTSDTTDCRICAVAMTGSVA
jgi:hypothetical protein